MGVDPKNRAAVQARRLQVKDEARDRGVILNQTFTSFEPDFWKKIVHSLFLIFNPKYGWSRDITEKVMKSICTDTFRNKRIRVKKRKLMQSESSLAPLLAGLLISSPSSWPPHQLPFQLASSSAPLLAGLLISSPSSWPPHQLPFQLAVQESNMQQHK